MDELQIALEKLHQSKLDTIVLSAARPSVPWRRANISKSQTGWQVERLSETQAFHENIGDSQWVPYVCTMILEEFTQFTGFSSQKEYSLKITKKGKILSSSRNLKNDVSVSSSSAAKNRLLTEGMVVPPLVDMGVMTTEGKIISSKYDKYRQINRFMEMIDDVIRKDALQSLRIVDFGSGKSYLTFLLYHYLTYNLKLDVEMVGLDLKADIVAACNESARRYGYTGLHFQVGDIAGHRSQSPIDMVVSLHACDTATDYALVKAVEWNSRYIFSVPCCQHELNGQIQSEDFSILTRYGIVQERTAALMTDALRANLLTYCGYKTQLLEFVDLSHTPKNIMIRGRKTALPTGAKEKALQEARALMQGFQLSPTLYKLLVENGIIAE